MAKLPATTQGALQTTQATFTAPKKQYTHRFLKPINKKTSSTGPDGIEMSPDELTRLVLQSTFVLILVGSEKTAFKLPKNLICAKSSFFNTAFNGPFQGGVEQTIILPEDEPTTFGLLAHWMFHDRILLIPEVLDVAAAAVLVRKLIDLYVMAGRYLTKGLLDESYAGIIEVIYHRGHVEEALVLMPASLVEHVWKITSPDSQLRFLVPEYLARTFFRTGMLVGKPIDHYEEYYTRLPGFAAAVITSMARHYEDGE